MSAAAVVQLADKLKLDMPICRAVNAIVSGTVGVDDAIAEPLARPITREN